MKKYLSIGFFICMSSLLKCQPDSLISVRDTSTWLAKENWDFGFKIGLRASENLDIGIILCNFESMFVGSIITSVSNEFVFDRGLFNPKVSVEAAYFYVGSRLNMVDYIYEGNHDLTFRPEIGLTLFGLITVYYGWDININNYIGEEVKKNAWNFTINFPLDSKRGARPI